MVSLHVQQWFRGPLVLVSICFNLQILRTTNTSEVARRKCGLSLYFGRLRLSCWNRILFSSLDQQISWIPFFTGHLQVVDMLEFQWIFIVPEYSCKVYLSIFLQEISWIEQPSGKTCFTIHRFRTLFFSWRTSAVPGCFGGNLWEFRRLNHGTTRLGCVCCSLVVGDWQVPMPCTEAWLGYQQTTSWKTSPSKVSWMHIPCQTWKFLQTCPRKKLISSHFVSTEM